MARGDKIDVSRRDVVKMAGASGLAGIAGVAGSASAQEYPPIGNFPVQGQPTFGFTVPQSGPYSSEGQDELRAYKLAVEHLNNGGGWVDNWSDLSGDGVLGDQVEFVTGDTATDADTARQTARRMIQRDQAIMLSGGSSSAVAIAIQELAQREKVQYMCCLTHSNDTTGKSCVRYSFREMFNAYMTAQALVPPVTQEYGQNNNFYQLYADYTWGQTVQSSMSKFFGEAGWTELNSVATPLGTKDFSSYLSQVPREKTDVLFLDHYGLDGSNSLTQAKEMGLDQDMEIIVPLYNRPMAQAAGGAIEGVYGTVAWDSQIDNPPSNQFSQAFQQKYNRVPSGVAQLAYAQTLQYAAAVERAGTFYPPEVIKQLEGYQYSNIGMGEETMRKCDHQAQRAVPVVKGLSADEQQQGQFYEIVNLTPKGQLGYACDQGPAAECDLGPYQ
ncbi:substrate-binding protein [Halorussus sp. MSC15.2]|uniref:substrate-binding protein n=1 Tax=Halorussus sp. MSC15.2 TaxID=2283638 RepID=UPI0013D01B71|nr:substrate-binding protein [Halorussus sp. MSC15.2]NEU56661.1 ABC transporter substrate-binding protein [Halorussus sp. MSC15.2]